MMAAAHERRRAHCVRRREVDCGWGVGSLDTLPAQRVSSRLVWQFSTCSSVDRGAAVFTFCVTSCRFLPFPTYFIRIVMFSEGLGCRAFIFLFFSLSS